MARMITLTMRLNPEFLEKLAAAQAAVRALQDVIRSDNVIEVITDPSEAE